MTRVEIVILVAFAVGTLLGLLAGRAADRGDTIGGRALEQHRRDQAAADAVVALAAMQAEADRLWAEPEAQVIPFPDRRFAGRTAFNADDAS
jgi:hypothetical protein